MRSSGNLCLWRLLFELSLALLDSFNPRRFDWVFLLASPILSTESFFRPEFGESAPGLSSLHRV